MDNTTLGAPWRKSTYSNGQGNCVEAASSDGVVHVRDTRLASASPVLTTTSHAFRAFLGSVKEQ